MNDGLLKKTNLGVAEGSKGGMITRINAATTGSPRHAHKVGILLVSLHFGDSW